MRFLSMTNAAARKVRSPRVVNVQDFGLWPIVGCRKLFSIIWMAVQKTRLRFAKIAELLKMLPSGRVMP
jgi:hypothetical protein